MAEQKRGRSKKAAPVVAERDPDDTGILPDDEPVAGSIGTFPVADPLRRERDAVDRSADPDSSV